MKNAVKNGFLLLGIGLTMVLAVQILEIPFHREFYRFRNLYLPLLLLSTTLYIILGVPLIAFLWGFGSVAAIPVRFFKKQGLPIALLLFAFCLWTFQLWALRNAELTVGSTYHYSIVVLVFGMALLTFWQRIRVPLAILGLSLLLVMSLWRAFSFWSPKWQAKAQGPNVLLLVADTLRRDHTSIYGYERETTPFLKDLSQNSVVFADTLSTSAWTKPAMASLLTSRYLEQDRILIGPLPIEWKGMRLPEFFRSSGYDTALFTANPNTGSYFEATRGYQWIHQPTPPKHFALQNFVLPKLFENYLRMKDWLRYRNALTHLESFQNHLGFSSASQLSKFEDGKLKSDKIPDAQSKAYQNEVHKAIRALALTHIRVRKAYPSWRLQYLIPMGDPIFQGILKFCFLTLEGAQGNIVNYWMSDSRLSQSFMDWFEKQYDGKKPFFAHLQYMGPHTPYKEQPPHLLSYFDPGHPYDIESPPSQHTLPSQGAKEMTPEGLYNMIANYDDAIRITDANMKDVVQFLEKKGVLENTLIVFASDHGEAFYEHKIYSHMYSLHAEIVNVPLFFHWPKKIKPSQSPLPASLVDIFPSLITLADLDRYRSKARDLEGMSLFQNTGQIADPSLFANRVRFGTTRISAQSTPKQRGQRRRKKGGGPKIEAIHRMVVKGNHKLIEEIENKKSTVYLYQLDDPKEVRVPQPAEFSPLVLSLMQEFRPLPQEYQDINEPQVDPDLDEHEPPPRLQKRDFLGKQKKKSKNQNITQRRRKRR